MITLIGENQNEMAPSRADLQDWAQAFGITHPVVADPSWGVTGDYVGTSFALPSMHLLAPGMEVLARDTTVTENQVRNALP